MVRQLNEAFDDDEFDFLKDQKEDSNSWREDVLEKYRFWEEHHRPEEE